MASARPLPRLVPEAPPPARAPDFHGAVSDFKRRLLESTLRQAGGNRTRAARTLGRQRTYLLRLIREFEIAVPPPAVPPPRGPGSAADGSGVVGMRERQTR